MPEPTDPAPPPPPPLRLVRGDASPEELAAVVAVLSAAAGAGAGDAGGDRAFRHTEWAAPARRLRMPVSPGPDGWRGSARPR